MVRNYNICPQAVSGDGFTLRWNVGCGGEFDSPSGHLVSPNYPIRVRSHIHVSNCLTRSMGAPSTAHGRYLLREPTTLWQLFLGSLILRERQGVAAGLILWRWWRWQLTKAEESIAVLTPLHPLPLWGQCGSTSKRTPQSTSKDKTLE